MTDTTAIKLTELVFVYSKNEMDEYPVWVARSHITHMRVEIFSEIKRTAIYLENTVLFVKEKPEDIL